VFAQRREGLGFHQHARRRDRAARSGFFVTGVDHADSALIVDVRKLCHAEK
jgi:hypothetical protein